MCPTLNDWEQRQEAERQARLDREAARTRARHEEALEQELLAELDARAAERELRAQLTREARLLARARELDAYAASLPRRSDTAVPAPFRYSVCPYCRDPFTGTTEELTRYHLPLCHGARNV